MADPVRVESAPRERRTGPRRSTVRVIGALCRLAALEELQYPANFVASLFGTVFWLTMAVLTVALFYEHTNRLGGWSFWETVVLLGVFNTLVGVVEGVLRPGIGNLPDLVRQGIFDLVLVRPVDAQLYLTFRQLDPWRVADIILGVALSCYALHRLGQPVSVAHGVAFALTLVAAVALLYSVWLSLMCLAFRFVAIDNLPTVFDAVFEAARYPVSAYPGALRFLFVSIVPIAWTTTVPASALVGRLGPGGVAESVLLGAAALVVSRGIWLFCLRRYASAGG